MSPALAGRFFTTEQPGKPKLWLAKFKSIKVELSRDGTVGEPRSLEQSRGAWNWIGLNLSLDPTLSTFFEHLLCI